MSDDRIHWEDLLPGSERALGRVTVSAEEIVDFARQFDPQPFHLDEEAGRASLFGGLCASGWHTCALAMRLTVDGLLRHSTSLGSPGLDSLQWLKPVYPGDTLSLTHTVLESRPLRSRPRVGMVRAAWKLFNQHGDLVMQMEGWGLFGRRHPADPAAPAEGKASG